MGQAKRVFVYRLVAAGTMEHFIYDRQASGRPIACLIWSDLRIVL